jgi:uncharacterized protein
LEEPRVIEGMFVFDAHVHIYGPMQTIWGYIGQTIETWVERMDENGIDMSQIMGDIAITPEEQKDFNDVIIRALRKYPDRFIGFSWVSPMLGEKALDEMKRGADLGLRGVKLYPNGHGFAYDSEIVDPVISLAHDLKWVVMAHTDIDSKQSSPHLAIRLAKRFPETNFIFSHMGMSPEVTKFIPEYVKDTPNIYLDTSDTPNLPGYVYTNAVQIIPNRILFGSDAPTLSPEVELKKIEISQQYYGLKEDQKRKILGENAATLFGIDTSRFYSSAH